MVVSLPPPTLALLENAPPTLPAIWPWKATDSSNADQQQVDWDYYGWSCEGAEADVSHLGERGTVYEFLGTSDLRIYFSDVCYPWWYDLAGYHWYVFNPLFAPGEATWETFDPICLDDMILSAIGTINAVMEIPCAYPTALSPYNWQQTGNGLYLQINYVWTSSTGLWYSLKACQYREYIEYGGDFPPPNPPWGTTEPPPNPKTGQTHPIANYYFTDNLYPGSFVKPYSGSAYWGDQKWEFRCPYYNNGQWTTIEGPNRFTRSLVYENNQWKCIQTKYVEPRSEYILP